MGNQTIEQLSVKLNTIIHEITKEVKGAENIKAQLTRCCSSIGANKAEAKYAESAADLVHKLKISLKECSETKYWLKCLYELPKTPQEKIIKAINICGSIERKLIESIKTVQK